MKENLVKKLNNSYVYFMIPDEEVHTHHDKLFYNTGTDTST